MRLLNICSEELEGGKEKGQVTGLRNVTVQAMSNLLSANIDSGLMHSISKLFCKFLSFRTLNGNEAQTLLGFIIAVILGAFG